MEEIEKMDKYLNLASVLKKMRVTVIAVVTGALGTIPNGLRKGMEELEIRGRMETIHTKALLRSVGILRRVLET